MLHVKALTMNKRVAFALPRMYEVRRKDLEGLHFEGWADPAAFMGRSYSRAVLCTVVGEEGRTFWIVGSFYWLAKGRLPDMCTVDLEGHPQHGERVQYIALT